MTLIQIFQQLLRLDRTTVTLSFVLKLEETLQYYTLIPQEHMLGECMRMLLTQYADEFSRGHQDDIATSFSRMALRYTTDPGLQIPRILIDVSALTVEEIDEGITLALYLKLQYVFFTPLYGDDCEAIRVKLCELARDSYKNSKFEAAYHLFRIAANFLQPIPQSYILFIQNSLNIMLSAVNSGNTFPLVFTDFQKALDNYIYSDDPQQTNARNVIANTLIEYGCHYYQTKQYSLALQFFRFSLPMHRREKDCQSYLIETLKNILRCAAHVNADEASKAIADLYNAIHKYKFEPHAEMNHRILRELAECRAVFEGKKLKAQEIMVLKIMLMISPKNKFFDKTRLDLQRSYLIYRERNLLKETLNEMIFKTPFTSPRLSSFSSPG